MKKFPIRDVDVVIGIDQTGAVRTNGKPKPLPAALGVLCSNGQWRFKKELWLDRLNITSIDAFLELHAKRVLKNSKVLICADCVFGLPSAMDEPEVGPIKQFSYYFSKAQSEPNYGFRAGESFFNSILKKKKMKIGSFPRRELEERLGANSVFCPQPFQRNIQTGTFRIWKDLGESGTRDFQLLPFDQSRIRKGRPLLIEGYPSLGWKLLMGKNERYSSALLSNLSKDHQDAFVLARLAQKWVSDQGSIPLFDNGIEGQILGDSPTTRFR